MVIVDNALYAAMDGDDSLVRAKAMLIAEGASAIFRWDATLIS